jgi:hypothetical protein
MAFFNAPGIERLYSGVTNSTASPRSGVLECGRHRRVVPVVVVAIQRQILERDLRQLELRRGDSDKRFGEQPIDRFGCQAADELPDLVTCHVSPPCIETIDSSEAGQPALSKVAD